LDKQKTSFFQNMSHELRTPLTLILNPLEEASKRYDTDDDLRVAIKNARRLLRLVNQLLDFQKLDAGRKKLSLRAVNLNQFLHVCGDYFNSACSTKGIDFTIRIDGPARVVEADPDALEKIIFNYLSNALKFTESGGSIELGLENVDAERYVNIYVRDSGNGIKPEDQKKLFEVFGQIEDSTTREYEGTGLGLALAKSLAQEMEASVGVESTWGEGATFYARFLLSRQPVDEIADIEFSQKAWLLADKGATGLESEIDNNIDDSPGELSAQHAKILVVDDLMDMRELIAKTLKSQGYSVLRAANGEQGLEVLLQHRPDLVISDWMMPKLSGPELVAKIRANPEVAGTPCILLTAKSDEESKLIGTQIGADVFLGKPFNSQELISTVRNLVALKAREKEVVELNHYITESVLKRYLPPSLITEIVAGRLSMDKPAELRPITVLFSDLAGFTKTSEALGPELIAAFLNAYFTKMNEVIFEHEGTIDKFIGDAIMVMFGAPNDVASEKQAHLAVACASAMQREMVTLCRQWDTRGAGELKMRIGIHQGPAVVGNFGSNQRSDYTCIGPTVNLAARIESAAIAGSTFVSDSVRSHFSEGAVTVAGDFSLKGFKEKQTLYRVVGGNS
jgi:adenylate cyclase